MKDYDMIQTKIINEIKSARFYSTIANEVTSHN